MDSPAGEAGAGRGYFTFKLARRVGRSGIVYANDIDEAALAQIESRCRSEGIQNIETVVGEIEDPRFPEEGLDLVIMVYALHDFAERLLGDAAEVVFPVPEGVEVASPLVVRLPLPESAAGEADDRLMIARSLRGLPTQTSWPIPARRRDTHGECVPASITTTGREEKSGSSRSSRTKDAGSSLASADTTIPATHGPAEPPRDTTSPVAHVPAEPPWDTASPAVDVPAEPPCDTTIRPCGGRR